MTTRRSSAVLNSLGVITLVLAAGAASYQVSGAPAGAEPAVSPPPHGAKFRPYENWRKSMSRTAVPEPGPGCHQAEYPSSEWKSVPCTVAPLIPHGPRSAAVIGANIVGNGTDYSAQLQGGGTIGFSEGSFGTSAIISENDNGAANVYTLQLNTNRFATSACSGVSGCIGWQQYIFDNNPAHGTAYLYIQYWLLNHPSNCPSGYTYSAVPGLAAGCYMNSAAVSVPLQPIQNLSALALTGTAVPGAFDQARLGTGTTLYSLQGVDSVLGAGNGWTSAEFNVFGEYNGTQATFGSGTLLSIETLVTTGASTTAPTVIVSGTTAETNNLTLAPLYCPVADPNGPYVWFQESFGATPASSCPVTPISLPAPTVTTTGPTGTDELERFTFTWPSVPGATYYTLSKSGAIQTITGNSSFVTLGCQRSVVVTISSCNAAGCGFPETILNARNSTPCI